MTSRLRNDSSRALAAATTLAVLLAATVPAEAGTYAGTKCVSKKQGAAAKFCGTVAKSWAKYRLNPGADVGGVTRDATIQAAAAKLDSSWTKAEDSATKKDADCSETTMASGTAVADIQTAIEAIETSIMVGADLNDGNDVKCRAKIIGAVGKLCGGLLKAQSKYLKALSKDPKEIKLNASRTKANDKFTTIFDKSAAAAAKKGVTCPTSETSASIIADAAALESDLVTDTTISQAVPTTWTRITPAATVNYEGDELKPQCGAGDEYSFWVRRGTENKLAYMFQGGGACWDPLTCFISPTWSQTADADDNPDGSLGFGDLDNPDNPFKDWNIIFVTYCTGDIHAGSGYYVYGSQQFMSHFGRINARVVEKYAREHFVNPDQVFTGGTSAGAYGAFINAPMLINNVYPASQHDVLGDAGIGVATEDWMTTRVHRWQIEPILDEMSFIPAMNITPQEINLVEMVRNVAQHFPNHRFASYQTAYEGSQSGQTGFYNLMRFKDDLPTAVQWWTSTCEWNACMEEYTDTIEAAASNYKSYQGAGTQHGVWNLDKVYTDTTGGVPTLKDWVVQMMDHSDTSWDTVSCDSAAADGCDVYIDTCNGGDNPGAACTQDADCPNGGTCILDPAPDPVQSPYTSTGVTCAPQACDCTSSGGIVACPAP